MELTGDILIGAPREKVWAGLNDPEILTRCIPGCEAMEVTSPTERTARVAVKVGPVRARFVGHVRMEDIRPNEGCVLRFQGSGGAAGMAKGHSNVELTDEAGGTRLRYTAQAAIGGKLGQVGGRMIDAASKQMADQFFTAFNEQMVGAPVVETVEAEHAEAAPTTATTPAPVAAQPAFVPRTVQAPQPAASGEGVRVLWFVLGSLSTGFGVWIASLLTS
ncbi:CoxG family protein [Hydrogenophaga sp.]|uniref:CoxG family protein n=1 Tax=Hydrogenophaga sp. TaxID=1904254 RepID=UPI002631F841|nr:carbon monoxide dehydrogenase subunit G [Hydrogenophaga sp.]